jgi:hypothetical protein
MLIYISYKQWVKKHHVTLNRKTQCFKILQLSEGNSKQQQLKKKSVATALNTVLASAHIQMT